jgi:hypothetical protein
MQDEKPKCTGCGAFPPETNTNYTLIGDKHRWRLVLEEDGAGQRVRRWWCPPCWARHREAMKRARQG